MRTDLQLYLIYWAAETNRVRAEPASEIDCGAHKSSADFTDD